MHPASGDTLRARGVVAAGGSFGNPYTPTIPGQDGFTGFDTLPPHWLARIATGILVMDTGDYAASLADGRMDRRPMFTAFDANQVVWADGTREPVDVVIYATGYLPHLDYLAPLGALAAYGL
ncbi:hypothetical protein [Nonomuraea sp. NPDC048916]|uniref:hypothetical protein n=1 Tax=Nonomuraea sp. NPDC048916 TaxID=3154232 RepID=UPI0033DC314D